MDEIIKMITDNGIDVVLIGYFLIKDWKTTGQIINVLGEIKEVLIGLTAMIHNPEGE